MKSKFNTNQIESGQSLIEIVFAFAVMTLIVMAVVGTSMLSIRNNSYSKLNTQATRFAQEAQEWIREEKEQNKWATFSALATAGGKTYCFNSNAWSVNASCPAMSGTILIRTATLTLIGTDVVTSKVTVVWTDSQGAHQVVNSTDYTKWDR